MSEFAPQERSFTEWYLEPAYKAVYVGLALGGLAMLMRAAAIEGGFLTFLRMVLMVGGLLAAGLGVWWRLASADANDFEEQSKTGILVALASGSVLSAWVALPADADSLHMAALVLWVVSLVAVPLILLPCLARRILLSMFVLFHFGGVLTAVTAVQLPNNAPIPWLPTVIWNNVYRNYLTFGYLNNAYHFYSPEPGPPTLVWFQVVFEDGSTYWKRIVRREDYPTRQQYQRMLSLTESTNQPGMTSPGKFQVLLRRRLEFTQPAPPLKENSSEPTPTIPMAEMITPQDQYREPSDLTKMYLQSYAAYMCRTTKHPDKPDLKVKSVRIYRLTHMIINAAQMESGLSPTDPTLFWAYFFGEYEYKPENKFKNPPEPVAVLKGSPYMEDPRFKGNIQWVEAMPDTTTRVFEDKARDPLLYWMLPIFRKPKLGMEGSQNLADYDLIDCLSIHSGDRIKWDQ